MKCSFECTFLCLGYVMTWHSWAASEPGPPSGGGAPPATDANCAIMRKDGLWEDWDCDDVGANYAFCMRAKCKFIKMGDKL